MKVYEYLHFLARGGRKDYLHSNGKENIKTTNLQNFLDEVTKRATERVSKRISKNDTLKNSQAMKRLEEKFKELDK